MSDVSNETLSRVHAKVERARHTELPDIIDEAFASIFDLSSASPEWANEFAGRLGTKTLLLGDFEANPPVKLWVPYTTCDDGVSTLRDGYVIDEGKNRKLLSISSTGDERVVTEEAVHACALWMIGGVLFNDNVKKFGVPRLITPERCLSNNIVTEALKRHFLQDTAIEGEVQQAL